MSEDPVAALADADEAVRERQAAVEAVGEDALRTVAEAHEELTALLDRYEEPATGTGDFEEFIHFQGEVATLVEDLPDDLPERDAFESVSERLHKRQLRGKHFERARADLEPVADLVDVLERRDAARERYREARRRVAERRRAVADRIDDLEALVAHEDVDFDAPVERLREPIEAYDEAVREAYVTARREWPARDFLGWAETVGRHFPLAGVSAPPTDLLDFLRERPAGAETVPTLVEWADYSRSKLDHYVEDPGRFLAVVGANRTALEGRSPDPLTVAWPPPAADRLRYRCDALIAAAGRLDADDAVARCREVQALARRDDYERLRRAAEARAELDDDERERVRSGAARQALADARAERERLADALAEHPER